MEWTKPPRRGAYDREGDAVNDPYLLNQNCVERLLREYHKHGKLIVAVDFDDTVFPFNNSGNIHNRVFELLQECQKREFYIVLFTASSPDRFDMMRDYMKYRGIIISSINSNPIPLPFGHNGKIYYNIFLDDRAGLGQSCDVLAAFLAQIWSDRYPQETNEHRQRRLTP